MDGAQELTEVEREVLLRILQSSSFPGRDELVAQVPGTRIAVGPVSFRDFVPDRSVAPSECPDGPVPVRALVEDAGGDPIGWILIWVEDGYLSALEFAWVTDDMPTLFPSPDSVRPIPPEAPHDPLDVVEETKHG